MRKVAIVTGGASGIGFAEASLFARSDYAVVLADIDQAAASKAVRQLGPNVIAEELDVRDNKSVETVFEKVSAKFGRIDVLINNAGMTSFETTESLSEARWSELINVNLSGAFRCAKAALPLFSESGGAIVNTSSVSALYVHGRHAAYCAAKGGIIALTRDLAVEWASKNIRVNAIAPGRILTPMLQANIAKGIRNAKTVAERIPLQRLGTPEEVAEVALFLADKATYITGQTIVVDGGFTIWSPS